jgi:MFS family permease
MPWAGLPVKPMSDRRIDAANPCLLESEPVLRSRRAKNQRVTKAGTIVTDGIEATRNEAAAVEASVSTNAAPAGASPKKDPVLKRDLRLNVADGALYGVMVGGGETYFQAFVLAIGLGEVFAGLVASLPVLIGSVLQLVSPSAVRTLGSHKRWVSFCSGLQAVCFVPLIAASVNGRMTATAVLFVASIYWAASLATGPAWNTWQGTIIPREIRAKFFAKRSRICQIATLVGFLGGGFALQSGREPKDRVLIFAWLFGISLVCRVLSTACLWFQSEPTPIPPNMRFLTLREQWRKFSRGPSGRLLVFAVGMQVGVYVAGPFFVPYMLKELGMNYTQFAILLGVSFVAKFVCLPFWGRLAHRTGAHRLLWIGAWGVAPLAFGWVISANYWWLLGLQLFAGSAWAAYELALVLLIFETIPESERTSLLTLYNLANSIALAAGSLIGAAILKGVGVGVVGYLSVFAASTVLRTATLLLLKRVPATFVTSDAVAVRPLSVRASGESLDVPILPGLPDQLPHQTEA